MLIKTIKLSKIFRTHKDVVENQKIFLQNLKLNINSYFDVINLDLHNVVINSTMAELLVAIHLILDYSNKRAILINVDSITEKLLEITCIDEYFKIKGDKDGKIF